MVGGLVAIAVTIAITVRKPGSDPGRSLEPVVDVHLERQVDDHPRYFVVSIQLPTGYEMDSWDKEQPQFRARWHRDDDGGDPVVRLAVNPVDTPSRYVEGERCRELDVQRRAGLVDGYQLLCNSSSYREEGPSYRVERYVRWAGDILQCVVEGDERDSEERRKNAWDICASMQVTRDDPGLEPSVETSFDLPSLDQRTKLSVHLWVPRRYEVMPTKSPMTPELVHFGRTYEDPAIDIDPNPKLWRGVIDGTWRFDPKTPCAEGKVQLRVEAPDGFMVVCKESTAVLQSGDSSIYYPPLGDYYVVRLIRSERDAIRCRISAFESAQRAQHDGWEICESIRVTRRDEHADGVP
jgi:hypothetical protein